jgi:hypothetical protein
MSEAIAKVAQMPRASFRRKPESRNFNALQARWTPVFTGVTSFAIGSSGKN